MLLSYRRTVKTDRDLDGHRQGIHPRHRFFFFFFFFFFFLLPIPQSGVRLTTKVESLENLANIRVPMIAAIEGRACAFRIRSDYRCHRGGGRAPFND